MHIYIFLQCFPEGFICKKSSYIHVIFIFPVLDGNKCYRYIYCVVPILYEFSKVRTSIMVSQNFQYQKDLCPVSKYRPLKYVLRQRSYPYVAAHLTYQFQRLQFILDEL